MSVKREIFDRLGTLSRPDAILATNTSYLDVNVIAAGTRNPDRVLGMHFFSPAHLMKLVELARGVQTAPEVMRTAHNVLRRLGKLPVPVGVCRGFVGNRILMARTRQLSPLLLDGASPEQIDAACRSFGWPMGPCEMMDMARLDISWRNRRAFGETDVIADALCEAGRFGQKVGKGWYDYRPETRGGIASAEVLAVIEADAAARSQTARSSSGFMVP